MPNTKPHPPDRIPRLTRQHFRFFAFLIRSTAMPHSARIDMARRCVRVCRQSNHRFDVTRFLKACGLSELPEDGRGHDHAE
jgi:hypothetical protein